MDKKIDITDMSFNELMTTLANNKEVHITCDVALKILERFEENIVETYGLEAIKK